MDECICIQNALLKITPHTHHHIIPKPTHTNFIYYTSFRSATAPATGTHPGRKTAISPCASPSPPFPPKRRRKTRTGQHPWWRRERWVVVAVMIACCASPSSGGSAAWGRGACVCALPSSWFLGFNVCFCVCAREIVHPLLTYT